MKQLRKIALKTASLIPSSLPHGEVVRIITKALKEQDNKYKELFEVCLPLKTRDDLSPIGKEIFTALVNIDLREHD